MGRKDELDRFYTHDDVAADCVATLDSMSPLSGYDVIVEPSAGSGSFSSLLPPGSLAFDMAPAAPGIERADWFDVTRSALGRGNRTLVIGNPPFGTRSSLARHFIRHSIELAADTIAFILPDTFAKESNQRDMPSGWRLVSVTRLRRNAFTLDGNDYNVPCSFFVWTRDDGILPGIDLRETRPTQPPEYRYLSRGDASADFCVNGNSGKVRDVSDVTNPKAEHYVKVNDGFDVSDVRADMAALDLDFRSTTNGGVAWVNRDDINRAFADARS